VLTIDGGQGEGGGQVLRTALTLSLVTGTPFRITSIRAGRQRPGLLRQHLTAVEAATAVGNAEVEGATLGATELVFRPRAVRPDAYRFAVGTAGSAALVLQTVLLPLAVAGAPSSVRVEGGTHNPGAPPFDFLERAFLPLLARMGAKVSATLDRPGFYPAGGGQLSVEIGAAEGLAPLSLLERGAITRRRARALVSHLPRQIGDRELAVVRKRLGWDPAELEVEVVGAGAAGGPRGPGNVLLIEMESEHVTEVFTGFGEVGVTAEAVAERATQEARRYLAAGVPVGVHLADQLLVPLALARGGEFTTLPLSRHATTNVEVVRAFLDVAIDVAPAEEGRITRVEVQAER
jgi:RNA 3'-terminal phosphate cyclase (ATP)